MLYKSEKKQAETQFFYGRDKTVLKWCHFHLFWNLNYPHLSNEKRNRFAIPTDQPLKRTTRQIHHKTTPTTHKKNLNESTPVYLNRDVLDERNRRRIPAIDGRRLPRHVALQAAGSSARDDDEKGTKRKKEGCHFARIASSPREREKERDRFGCARHGVPGLGRGCIERVVVRIMRAASRGCVWGGQNLR